MGLNTACNHDHFTISCTLTAFLANPSVPFSDIAARNSQSRRPEAGYGTWYGSETVGQEDQTLQQRATSPRPWKCFLGEAGDVGSEAWEERLQETIRFVFSHEQEGLLTIGTFALDQLEGVTNHIKPPAPNHHSVSSVQMAILEVRSPDDEIDLQQSVLPSAIPAPCRRNLESDIILSDHDAPISCRLLSLGSTKPVDTCKDPPSCTDSANGETHAVAGIKQVVLSTTDGSEVFDKSDSEDFYSPGVCSLFASRSRRTQKSAKEKHKKLPERRTDDAGAYELKRTGSGRGSLGAQLGRLWRSGCNRSVSPEVPPEKKLTPGHKESQALVRTSSVGKFWTGRFCHRVTSSQFSELEKIRNGSQSSHAQAS